MVGKAAGQALAQGLSQAVAGQLTGAANALGQHGHQGQPSDVNLHIHIRA